MIVPSKFRPAPWLRNRHLQTLFASECRRRPSIDLQMQSLELPDGDYLELAWANDSAAAPRQTDDNRPLAVLLHGVIGSVESKYARGMLRRLHADGWRAVLMLFRGAGGKPNRLPRGYHSGETGDFRQVLDHLRSRFPHAPMAAIGFSMGGNVLLKYLGETGGHTPLTAAAAVSVPFDLDICARAIDRGLARHYQRYIITSMRAATTQKFSVMDAPIALPDLNSLKNFFEFDDAVTAPLHGFDDVHDYYNQASSRPWLKRIVTPTLVLHALDDPFMTPEVVPAAEDLSEHLTLEVSPQGGHVGFISAGPWGRPRYWLEERIPEFLCQQMGWPGPANQDQSD